VATVGEKATTKS